MNAASAVILVILALGVVALPRRGAAMCMVAGALFLTQGAALDLAALNVFPTRLLGYLCFFRVMARGEFSFSRINKTDKALIILYLFTTPILLFRPEESALLRFARLSDTFFTYFAFRGLITSPGELRSFLGTFALLLVPFVGFLALESRNLPTLFDFVGGSGKLWLRGESIRCFGSFRHPSLLGSLGACFLPLFVALAWNPEVRRRAILGAALCIAVVGFSNSGGPLSALSVAGAGWLLWPIRERMRTFRIGAVAMIAVLAMSMKAPIWYLLAKLSSVTGGTGWHRSYLMDVAFQHLSDWWLIGMPVSDTRGWMPYALGSTGGADITNEYIAFGLRGGLAAVALFVFLIVRGFSHVGQAMHRIRSMSHIPKREEALLWGCGVVLATHSANWLGITYFDQFFTLWLLQLAILVSVSDYWLHQRNEAAAPHETGGDDSLAAGAAISRETSAPATILNFFRSQGDPHSQSRYIWRTEVGM